MSPLQNGPREAVTLPLWKKLSFSAIIALAFFVAAEVVLLIAGVRPVIWDEDPYVGFESAVGLYQPTNDGNLLETAPNKLALFNQQRFDRRKSDRAYRIFTLGGSTTYGRPFDDATSFSGWLRTYLRAAAPETEWEVINSGAISYASYRVAKLMEELIDYQPDLFVIYSGNNEFLERRSYADVIEEHRALTRTRLALAHSRVFTLAQRIRRTRSRNAEEAYRLKGEVDEILNRSTGLEAYERDGSLTGQILAHYRFNLARMVTMARSVGSRVVLVTLPVNEKDFAPFKSQFGDQVRADGRRQVRTLLERAEAEAERGDLEAARASLEEAIAIDPRYAETHYRLGRVLLALENTSAAEGAFRRAIVEDVCPLRALPAANEALREVAAEREVALLDFEDLLKSRMQDAYGHRSPGDEYFLDHVHPTVEANGLLARDLLDRLAAESLVQIDPGWHDRIGAAVTAEVQSRADDEARAVAFKNLSKVLIWAGKKKEAERYARRAQELLGDDWEVHYNAGVMDLEAGDPERALASFNEAIRLNPRAAEAHDFLGTTLARLGRSNDAIASGERAVAIAPDRAMAHNNLAISYADAGRFASAREAARRAIQLAPDLAEAHNSLGNALFAEDRLDEALRSYDRAIRLLPGYVEARVNRGLVLGAQDRLSDAVKAFSEALHHDERSVSAHVGLGRARLGLGDAAAAIAAFEKAVSLDSTRGASHEWLARALIEAGRQADALDVLRRGLAADPDSPGLLNLSAHLAASEQRFEEAIALLRRALAKLPDAQEATVQADEVHHTLANLLILTNRVEVGRTHLRQALALNPDNVRALNDLGLVYEHEGQLARAAEQYERATRLDAGFEVAARNLERVRERLASR